MPPIDQVPTFGAVSDQTKLPSRAPIPFKIVGYDGEKNPFEFAFHARGSIPLGVSLDLLDGDPARVLDFLRAVIVPEDSERWEATLHDGDYDFVPEMLEEFAKYFSELYGGGSAQDGGRPTSPQSAFSDGRGRTGAGSTVAPSSPPVSASASPGQ